MVERFRARFPPPWRVEKTQVGYLVIDGKGEKVLPVYAYSNSVVRSTDGWGRLSWSQAHALAKAICKLAETHPVEEPGPTAD